MLKNKLAPALSFVGILVGTGCLQAEEVGLYNQSSLYSCENSWDIKFTVDYIYWTWQQAMMQVGTVVTPTASGSDGFFTGTNEVIFQTPGYTSGFQVGLGCDFHGMDDWNLMAEYTWYQNNNLLRTVTGSDQYFAVSPTIIKQLQGTSGGVLLSADLVTGANLQLDGLDVQIQKSLYLSRNITTSFGMGLKALWIHETAFGNGSKLSYVQAGSAFPVAVAGTFQASLEQRSWGVGPCFGLNSEWLLGAGIKVMGNVGMSILYTSYITLQTAMQGQVSNRDSADLLFNQPHPYNTLNPVGEASLGLGWGSYLCNENLYLSLIASYDWNVFWNYALLDVITPSNGSPGNMTLRGLNARVGLDF